MKKPLAIRWTVGDVSSRGFDALALSVTGALALFGPDTQYAISVNTVPVRQVQDRLGNVSSRITWHCANERFPDWLATKYLDSAHAEGVAWKFAPVRLFPDRHELSLDNDVILWAIPESMKAWLNDEDATLLAEDVKPAFGVFARWCPEAGRNSGIRGLPPGYDLESAMRHRLESDPVRLSSELDEQGLQVAVLTVGRHYVTTLAEVTICSPIPPHLPHFGRYGAHFVGVNAKKLPWEWNGRAGETYIQEHWDNCLPAVRAAVARGQPAM